MVSVDPHEWYVSQSFQEALIGLALDPDEQVRAQSPACVMCELLTDYELYRRLYLDLYQDQLSQEQRSMLDVLTNLAESEAVVRFECFDTTVLTTAPWNELRQRARETLQLFGWTVRQLPQFREVRPGVWQREDLIKE